MTYKLKISEIKNNMNEYPINLNNVIIAKNILKQTHTFISYLNDVLFIKTSLNICFKHKIIANDEQNLFFYITAKVYQKLTNQ